MRSRRGSLHTQDVADLRSASLTLLLLASTSLAGSLKREGWHRCHLSSPPASAAEDFSHSISRPASAQPSGGGSLFSPCLVWAAPTLCIPGNSQPTWRGRDHSLTLRWPCLATDISPFLINGDPFGGKQEGSRGCEYSSCLADFSAERPCELKGPRGRIDGCYLLCHEAEP